MRGTIFKGADGYNFQAGVRRKMCDFQDTRLRPKGSRRLDIECCVPEAVTSVIVAMVGQQSGKGHTSVK